MKEERFFYAPHITSDAVLPKDEAAHATRVLRMRPDDQLWVMDGEGHFYDCRIEVTGRDLCQVRVIKEHTVSKTWLGTLTLAVAPTKNIDRIEWLVEKAVEIGVDRIVFLSCDNSERSNIKKDRLERIVISAIKQSRKPFKTELVELVKSTDFMHSCDGQKFFAHCMEGERRYFLDEIARNSQNCTIMIGPEGDFSPSELKCALDCGFIPVTLGKSRLRTETAALMGVSMMQIAKEINS